MKLPRRTFLHLAAGAAALPAASRFAWAQTYPTKPVRILVGFAPGGGARAAVSFGPIREMRELEKTTVGHRAPKKRPCVGRDLSLRAHAEKWAVTLDPCPASAGRSFGASQR
jgi:hypothetical protein